MKLIYKYLCIITVVSFVGGCATTTLDITVDVFEKSPSIEQPLSDRKVEAMLQDLYSLQKGADYTLQLKTEMAVTSAALYEDALNLLPKPLLTPSTYDCNVLQDSQSNSSDVSPVSQHLAKYLDCIKQNHTNFTDDFNDAIDALSFYLTTYRAIYAVEASTQCILLGYSLDYCTSVEVMTEQAPTSPLHSDTSNRVRTIEVTEDGGQPFLVDKDFILQRMRLYLVESAPMGESCVRIVEGEESKVVRHYCDENRELGHVRLFTDLEVDTLAAVSQVAAAYQKISLPTFYLNWVALEHLMNAQLVALNLERDYEHVRLWQQFSKNLQRELTALASRAGADVSTRTLSRTFDNTSFQGANLTLANELEALRNDMPLSASSQLALEGLVKNKSSLNALIDRLQNAGDPVWRLITDSAYEDNWNNVNSLHFSADGKSSIVVIRDTPTRFRTSNARNNPQVLVENQLIISQAVTQAAIETAGVVTGLRMPPLTGESVPESQDGASDQQASAQDRVIAARIAQKNKRCRICMRNYGHSFQNSTAQMLALHKPMSV